MAVGLTAACDRALVSCARAPAALSSPTMQRWTLVSTILGSSLAFIDSTAVSVSLPALAQQFNASAAEAQWIVAAYTLPLSALVLTGGALSDRFGARNVFSIGVLLFAIASAGCSLTQSAAQLIMCRTAQGVAASLLVPSSLALLGAAFAESERGRAIGAWSAFASLSGALGPLVGGWLIDRWSWRLVFLINVPLAAATLAIVAAWVADRPREGAHRIDVAGAAAISIALAAITAALTLPPAIDDRTAIMMVLWAIGGAAFALFFFVEARIAHPMMPLDIWKSVTFAGVNALTFVIYAAVAMLMFELPLYLIEIKGYSALGAAAALLPLVIELFVLSRPAGAWASRAGPGLPLTLGAALLAGGFGLLAAVNQEWPGMLTLGLGMALIVAPLTTAVMAALDRQHAGLASGVNNAVARVAGLLGVAAIAAIAHAESPHDLAAAFDRVMLAAAGLSAIGVIIAMRLRSSTVARRC